MRNVVSNFLYQSIFQITKILLPIITVPIISRALGPGGVGVYNFTFSVTQYFVLLAGLGVSLYGNREIAISCHDRNVMSVTFFEIFLLKLVTSVICLLGFIVFLIFSDSYVYFILQIFYLVGILIDISWFFMGIEDFKKTSLSSLVAQIGAFIGIVCLVHKPEDLYIYILIQSLSTFVSQLCPWFFLKNHIEFSVLKQVKWSNVFRRFKTAFSYLIPQISINFYTSLNKILLGIFIGSAAVGYYSNSQTINMVAITLITTIDFVLLPKMSNLFSKNDTSKMLDIISKMIDIQLYFSIGAMFGILTIYEKFIPWFFGNGFEFLNQLIPLFSMLIVITPLGISIARQYLLPRGDIRHYNISVFVGAVINVLLVVLLLPTLGIYGVVIANIMAEISVIFSRLIPLYRQTNFRLRLLNICCYIFSGIIMFLVTRYITRSLNYSIATTLIQILIGVFCYVLMTTILKKNVLFNLLIKQKNVRKIE